MAGISSPLQLFGDFGFSGGQDVAPNPLQNTQICINYYAEVNKQNPKEILGLLGAPGLVQLVFAPGGGVPASNTVVSTNTISQVFEVNMAGLSPIWSTGITGSSPQLVPAIVSVSPTIDLIDRNYAAGSFAASAGDGNVYHFSATTGTYISTTAQSAAPATYKNWQVWSNNWASNTTYSNGATANRAGFVMATLDGNNVLVGATNQQLQSITGFVTNTSASWPNGVFVYDFGNLLFGTSGFLSTDVIAAVFPCADKTHVIAIITAGSGGTAYKWAIINCLHGSEAVVSHGTVASGAQNVAVGGQYGTASTVTNGYATSASTNSMACLQSDLQNLWIVSFGHGGPPYAQLVLCSINPSTQVMSIKAPAATTGAFPNTNAAGTFGVGLAIWADNGVCAILAGQTLTVWTYNVPIPAPLWPHPSSVLNLPVRGLWELPNDSTALAVIGNTCFLVKVATPATASSFPTLSLTSVGTLQTNIGPVHIRDNNAGGYAVIVDGPYGYLYNIATQAFAQITDPSFLGANRVVYIDGWWVFNQPGTQSQVFYTQAQQYGITFNASNFALKDGASDRLVSLQENKEQLWLLGDKTTEIWYDAGGQYFAFQRLVGTMLQFGCKAVHSPARFNTDGQDGIIWFGRSERGENQILRSRGFSVDVVSTPAFSNEVAQYPVVSDAIGYTYQEDTHEFYVLTFPTADTTWCYDSQSGLLHKRLSYDPYLQQFHRHRSNCFMNFQGMRIVGDYQCGSLYQLTRNSFTDAGWPILAKRRSPHIWDKGQRGRVFMASLQIDFQQGVGNASGLGSNPQATLQISRDGGKTFGQRWPAPIGQIGLYKNRTMWRRLAFGRDNVVDIEVIDPVPRDIIGVTLKAFSSA